MSPVATPRQHARLRLTALVAAAASLITLGLSAAPASAGSPAVAPVDDYPPALATFYTQTLDWAPCLADLLCSWLTVPLDYADPAGATIRIRVAKSPATGPAAQRQGSLVINPGGPGGSGVEFTSYTATALAPAVAEQFDIVGFDTRGVGKSAPITCMTGAQITRWLRTDGSPNTAAEERRLVALAAQISRGCLSMSPTLAAHVGSENTVRDMDILRQALADPKMNFLGFSYGTYLGALYAEAFPDRVGRFVLDGAVDPSLNSMGISQGQSTGFQTAINRFAQDCARRASCPYSGSASSVLRGINRLLARLDARPMPTGGIRTLGQPEALTAIFYSLYSPQIWPSLRESLRQATRNDGSGLLGIADYANDRTGPNQYGGNMASAFYSISCWDMPSPPGADGLRQAGADWSRGARVPEMAVSMAWGNAPCSTWYGHSARLPAPAVSTTTAPIVVVGTIYDPATPFAWAVALSQQLTTSTLLTFRGDGHTAYGAGSRCIDRAIDAYFLRGTMPAPGTVCS